MRDKVFSESLFRGKYSAVIKDEKSCYHLRYPYDADSRSIDFENRNPIISFKSGNPNLGKGTTNWAGQTGVTPHCHNLNGLSRE